MIERCTLWSVRAGSGSVGCSNRPSVSSLVARDCSKLRTKLNTERLQPRLVYPPTHRKSATSPDSDESGFGQARRNNPAVCKNPTLVATHTRKKSLIEGRLYSSQQQKKRGSFQYRGILCFLLHPLFCFVAACAAMCPRTVARSLSPQTHTHTRAGVCMSAPFL